MGRGIQNLKTVITNTKKKIQEERFKAEGVCSSKEYLLFERIKE